MDRLYVAIGLVLLLGGCVRAFESRRASDGRSPADAPRSDAPRSDAPRSDGPLFEVLRAADAPRLFDQRRDGPAVLDAGLVKPDKPQPSPCAAGMTVKTILADTVVCTASFASDQCSAGKLCNAGAGWSLCPASVYRARVKATPPSDAWIAGRLPRSGFALQVPVDGVCPACVQAALTDATVMWTCTAGAPEESTDLSSIGLSSDLVCHRVGVNDPATEGYWRPTGAHLGLLRSVCCK